MARRRRAEKRAVLPDPKFGEIMLTKLMNYFMYGGNKSRVEGIIYGALDIVQEKLKTEPLAVLRTALDNIKPSVEVRSRRVGGATYQVPVEVRTDRQEALAMRWLRDACRKRSERTARERLAGEIMDAAEKRGGAMKKCEETLKMAEANRAFAHYRW